MNCRSAALGSLPLLAGSGDRSPPPPPPCMVCFSGLQIGRQPDRRRHNDLTACLTPFCTGLVENTVKQHHDYRTWKPVDIMKDFFWRP